MNGIRIQGCHLLWRRFPTHFFSSVFFRSAVLLPRQCRNTGGLGCSPVARHYWGNHSCFLFLQVLRCFSSLRWPPLKRMTGLQPDGLSHSEIPGSRVICTWPGLIAACHVLHRLREPRHPPAALDFFSYVLYADLHTYFYIYKRIYLLLVTLDCLI